MNKEKCLLKDYEGNISFEFSSDIIGLLDRGQDYESLDEEYESFKLDVIEYIKSLSMNDIKFHEFFTIGSIHLITIGVFIIECEFDELEVNVFGIDY